MAIVSAYIWDDTANSSEENVFNLTDKTLI